MKIGVFGDSFCDSLYGDHSVKWWHHLEQFGHQVTCFGEASSSILYSAQLVKKHKSKFDFLIWTVTEPGRISLKIDEEPRVLHYNRESYGRYNGYVFNNETKLRIKITKDFHQHIFDDDEYNFASECIVRHLLHTVDNLMVIPCFNLPISMPFTLYQLSEWEASYYFPKLPITSIYKKYEDLRPCHLSTENNKILAERVANNLNPGIFQTDYNGFKPPTEPLEHYWKKY